MSRSDFIRNRRAAKERQKEIPRERERLGFGPEVRTERKTPLHHKAKKDQVTLHRLKIETED